MTGRQRIPNRRMNERIGFQYNGRHGYIIAGFPMTVSGNVAVIDDKPGEFFIVFDRVGSDVEAAARDAGLLLSIAAQYGVDPRAFALSVTRKDNGEPASVIGAALDAIVNEYWPRGEA